MKSNQQNLIVETLIALVGLFFPKLCICCYKKSPLRKGLFCLQCKVALPFTDQCEIQGNDLEDRIFGRFKYTRAAALFRFNKKSKVQTVIHQLKYANRPQIGQLLGEQMGKKILESKNFDSPDIIIPIPLYYKKQKKRGYNQSYLFAKGLAEVLKVPIENKILVKEKATVSQTQMNRFQRLENVYNSFTINNPNKIIGKSILLVDDVITTGATIEAAAQKLLETRDVSLSLAIIAMAEL